MIIGYVGPQVDFSLIARAVASVANARADLDDQDPRKGNHGRSYLMELYDPRNNEFVPVTEGVTPVVGSDGHIDVYA